MRFYDDSLNFDNSRVIWTSANGYQVQFFETSKHWIGAIPEAETVVRQEEYHTYLTLYAGQSYTKSKADIGFMNSKISSTPIDLLETAF
jgi:hypothetical protein